MILVNFSQMMMSRDGSLPHAPTWVGPGDMRSVVAQPLNSRVSLNCRASGQPPPTIRWTKDGLALNQTFEEGLDFKVQSSCSVRSLLRNALRGLISNFNVGNKTIIATSQFYSELMRIYFYNDLFPGE